MSEIADVKNIYDQWHRDLYQNEEDGYALSKVWYQKTIENLPDLSGKRVLEIGCGRGEFSNFLSLKFPTAKIVATDFSEGAIEVCKLRFSNSNNIEFIVEDVQRLRFPDATFDFIVCCETLEHVPDVEIAVSEIYRVLTKGGGVVITTPSYFNAYSLVWIKCWLLNKPFSSGQGVQPFEHYYTSYYVRRLIRRSGFHIDKIYSTHFQWLVWPKTDPAILRTDEFKSALWNRVFRAFGVHFIYVATK